MNTKTSLKILSELELTEVEKQLLEVNRKLLSVKNYSIKKIAIQGINNLLQTVNFKFWLKSLPITEVGNTIIVRRW